MIETETSTIFDLERLSAQAEILRGTSDRFMGRILVKKAVNSGFDGRQFRSVLNGNLGHWRDVIRAADRRYGWWVTLGNQGQNSSLVLENGQLDETKKTWAELQLIGYLSRIDVVEVEKINPNGTPSEWVHGKIGCIRTSLGVTQEPDSIRAVGYGPQTFNTPPDNQ